MARAARIALDLALVSLRTVRPVVSKVWSVTKTKIVSTPAKPLVSNPVVVKVESILDKILGILVSKLTDFRNHQLVGELKYLEKEVEKIKKEIMKCGATTKELNSRLAVMWRYAKTELAPPMTISFLHGPTGQKLERIASNATQSLEASLTGKIKEIDDEEERVQQEKENAIKKAIEKAKAEEKKRAEVKKRNAEKNDTVAKQSDSSKAETLDKKSEKQSKETIDNKKTK